MIYGHGSWTVLRGLGVPKEKASKSALGRPWRYDLLAWTLSWVAVKELKLNYRNMDVYIYIVNNMVSELW